MTDLWRVGWILYSLFCVHLATFFWYIILSLIWDTLRLLVLTAVKIRKCSSTPPSGLNIYRNLQICHVKCELQTHSGNYYLISFSKILSKVPSYPAELLPHLPTSAFSPPPMKATPAAPTIFRPPGLEESEEEAEEADEPTEAAQYPSLCSPFPPVSYPSMLRLLNPHLYRNHLSLYHPYFPHRYYHTKWNGTMLLNLLVDQIKYFLPHFLTGQNIGVISENKTLSKHCSI